MVYDWFRGITFAQPWVLILLLLVPVIIVWYLRNNRKRQASMLVTTTHFISEVKSYKTLFQNVPFYLKCLALACVIVALARPQQKFTEENTEGEGIDIMFCFDISGSMMAKDFIPNRLEASKELAMDFVTNRPGDNIGIVIFSAVSFTLCPITSYHDAVFAQMQNIRSGYLENEGTAIGSGIATCVDRLKDSKSKSKIIILLTDGVDYGGTIPPDIAKEMAKLYNIKIYTIGVGSGKEIEEEVDTPLGRQRQKLTLEFNENLLKEIATETGGQYFNAKSKESLQLVYANIDKLEKSKIKRTTYHRFEEKFLPFALAAIVLLMLDLILRFTILKRFP